MIRRVFILAFFSFVIAAGLLAQTKEVETDTAENLVMSIQFLSNDDIGDINFKVDPFAAHGKRVIDLLEDYFAEFEKPQEIVVLETFYPDKNPTFRIHARPAMMVRDMEVLTKKLHKLKAVRSLYVKFHIAYIAEVKGGAADQKASYVPNLLMPVQMEFEALEDSSLIGKRRLIQQWAREEVLPVLAAFENDVDEKFEGVRAMGKVLRELDWDKKVDVIALTEKNPDYWRATVEMSMGNHLIAISNIFLHIANGEFDYVKMHIAMLPYFADRKSVASYYLRELKWRMEIFDSELAAQVNGGIMMHDGGKFQEAIKTYKRILRDYPKSAWTLYELYYSSNAYNIYLDGMDSTGREEWDAAKGAIYEANPLYGMDVRASNGREGYLIFRRAEIQWLFKEQSAFSKDFIQLADIAMDLQVYGLAAHFYWMGFGGLRTEDTDGRDLQFYFLYCMDKLGNTSIKESFQGDMPKEFKRIADELDKHMKESPMYKAFEKGE